MAVHCRWCVRKYKEGQFVDDFVQDSDIVISRSDVHTYAQVDCWAIYSLLLIDSWIPIHQPPPIRLNRTRIFNFHTSHVSSRFSYHRIAYKISRRPSKRPATTQDVQWDFNWNAQPSQRGCSPSTRDGHTLFCTQQPWLHSYIDLFSRSSVPAAANQLHVEGECMHRRRNNDSQE